MEVKDEIIKKEIPIEEIRETITEEGKSIEKDIQDKEEDSPAEILKKITFEVKRSKEDIEAEYQRIIKKL